MIKKRNGRQVAIFGAGQAGRMAHNWLPAGSELLCYIDNDPAMQNRLMDGTLVRSLEQGLLDDPDLILIAVLNKESEAAIHRQIREAGYDGEIRSVSDIQGLIDVRLAALRLLAAPMAEKHLDGVCAELGVYRGAFAAEINRLFPDKKLYLFDTFTGFDERDLHIAEDAADRYRDFSDTSEQIVRSALPHPEQAVFVKGYFPESLAQLPEKDDLSFVLVSLDPDLYNPAYSGMEYFYPRLVKGGMILVHDYTSTQFPGVRQAVDRYAGEHGIIPIPLMDLHGTAVIVKP